MTQTPPSSTGNRGPGAAAGQPRPSQGAVDQAQQKASQVVDQAQGVAGQVKEQAKEQATSQLASQKDRAVDGLVTVAQALRQTGQTLQQQQQGTVAGYVEEAAQRVESATNYLRAHDVQEVVEDTQDLARRQPALFLTGALALGFIGARFLMSSGQRAATQRRFGASSGYGSEARRPGPAVGYSGYPAGTPGQLGAPRDPVIERTQAATPPRGQGVGGGLDV